MAPEKCTLAESVYKMDKMQQGYHYKLSLLFLLDYSDGNLDTWKTNGCSIVMTAAWFLSKMLLLFLISTHIVKLLLGTKWSSYVMRVFEIFKMFFSWPQSGQKNNYLKISVPSSLKTL